MHPLGTLAGTALVLAALSGYSSGASATSCPSGPLWTFEPAITGTAASSSLGLSFIARGSTLSAIWSETGSTPVPHTGGAVKWVWTIPDGSTLNNFPSPVPLSTAPASSEFLFVGGTNGFLYKLDASTGDKLASVDVRRVTCPADKMTCTPAIQLYNYSNGTFQTYVNGAHGTPDDLVFVITNNQCGDHAQNKIRAYWASNLAPAWTFNSTGSSMMDYGTEGCTVDYARNVVFCGTEQTLSGQPTLWAVRTNGGSLMWSQNVGAIRNRPTVAPQNPAVYVPGWDGSVRKHDPNTGAPIWVAPSLGASIVRGLWLDSREPLDRNRIFAVDTDGRLRVIQDEGSSPSYPYAPVTPSPAKFVSMPVLMPAAGKLYLGRDDGRLQQVDASTGTLEPFEVVGAPGTVFDPALDSSLPLGSIDRVVVASETSVRRFCVPWGGSVSVEDGTDAPTGEIALLRSAPNPFQAGTAIEYRLARETRIDLAIFGLNGEHVRSLVAQRMPAGRHVAVWDGRDDGGSLRANGVYFCRLRVDEGTAAPAATRKIELLR